MSGLVMQRVLRDSSGSGGRTYQGVKCRGIAPFETFDHGLTVAYVLVAAFVMHGARVPFVGLLYTVTNSISSL